MAGRFRLGDMSVAVVAVLVLGTAGCGQAEETRACSFPADLPTTADPYATAATLRAQDIEEPAIRQAVKRLMTAAKRGLVAQAGPGAPSDPPLSQEFIDAVNDLRELCP